jgi:hypothetical protein
MRKQALAGRWKLGDEHTAGTRFGDVETVAVARPNAEGTVRGRQTPARLDAKN